MPTPTIEQTLEYVRKSPRFQERTAEDKKFIEESLENITQRNLKITSQEFLKLLQEGRDSIKETAN